MRSKRPPALIAEWKELTGILVRVDGPLQTGLGGTTVVLSTRQEALARLVEVNAELCAVANKRGWSCEALDAIAAGRINTETLDAAGVVIAKLRKVLPAGRFKPQPLSVPRWEFKRLTIPPMPKSDTVFIPEPVLDEIDINLLTAVSESPHAMKNYDLAAAAECDAKTCGTHVRRLVNLSYLTRKSPRTGVSITAQGRARLGQVS